MDFVYVKIIEFSIKFVDMFMVYLHTKFHTPSSSGSLVIAFRPKAKHEFYAAAIL
jgi:hypothetical protein